jgi:hypothetical protein
MYKKMSSFKLLQRLFQVEKPIMLGRWGSVNAVRNSELSNHDHCGTCPTHAVGHEDFKSEVHPPWTPELYKHSSHDNTTDTYFSTYTQK